MTLPSRTLGAEDPTPQRDAAVALLAHHAEKQRGMDRARDVLIEASRNADVSWSAIGEALGCNAESLRVQWAKRPRQEV